MRNTIKLFAAALFVAFAVAACNKPAENADTDGKDSIETTTTPVDTTAAPADTTTAPADTTTAQ